MPLASRRGLTFVELLLAATIFAILLVGVSGHLRSSVVVWRRSVAFTDDLQQARVALTQLERDLAHAFVFDESGKWEPKPTFENTKLQFYTTVPPPQAAEGDPGSVRFVTYKLDTDGDVTALVRTSQTVQEAHVDPEGTSPSLPKQRLLEPLDQLEPWSVKYGLLQKNASMASQMTWETPWDYAGKLRKLPNLVSKLPNLVRITVKLKRPFPVQRELRLVATVPAGTLQPQ